MLVLSRLASLCTALQLTKRLEHATHSVLEVREKMLVLSRLASLCTALQLTKRLEHATHSVLEVSTNSRLIWCFEQVLRVNHVKP